MTLRHEFKVDVESGGNPRKEEFWCWATNEDDAIQKAWAWKPGCWVTSVTRFFRAKDESGNIVSTWK